MYLYVSIFILWYYGCLCSLFNGLLWICVDEWNIFNRVCKLHCRELSLEVNTWLERNSKFNSLYAADVLNSSWGSFHHSVNFSSSIINLIALLAVLKLTLKLRVTCHIIMSEKIKPLFDLTGGYYVLRPQGVSVIFISIKPLCYHTGPAPSREVLFKSTDKRQTGQQKETFMVSHFCISWDENMTCKFPGSF